MSMAEDGWKRHFTWRPVYVYGKKYWFRWVLRRWTDNEEYEGGGYWDWEPLPDEDD